MVFILKSFRKANPAMDDDATTKCSSGEENDRIKYAASSMKGFRYEMEDAVSNIAVLCKIVELIILQMYIINFALLLW